MAFGTSCGILDLSLSEACLTNGAYELPLCLLESVKPL